jgi:BMFP domain-containing protein YqiC
MAQKARAAQEALEQRVAALEARLAQQPPSEEAAAAPLRSRPATKRANKPPPDGE